MYLHNLKYICFDAELMSAQINDKKFNLAVMKIAMAKGFRKLVVENHLILQ